jgi:N-acetylneuraminic acid mutarotase
MKLTKYHITFFTFLLTCISFSGILRSQNSWTRKADLGCGPRSLSVGFSIGSKGYFGTGSGNASVGVSDEVWEYDPVANTWTKKANYGGGKVWGAVGFSIGGKGYIGTGKDSAGNLRNDFWEYDPVSDTWTRKADFPGTPRHDALGFSIGTKGYLGTGGGDMPPSTSTKDFWEYDPTTNTWTKKADFGGGLRDEAIGFSIGNKGYAGMGLGSSRQKDFWEYDPSLNQWTQKSDFGGGVRVATLASFAISSLGYVGTGSNGSCQKDFWQYNPADDSWIQKIDFGGVARTEAVGFSIGNKGYIGSGLDSNIVPQKDFWEFIPDSFTGVNEFASKVYLKNYPNPFHNITTIDYSLPSEGKDLHIFIYDLYGRIVKTYNIAENISGSIIITASELSKGTYLCSMISGRQRVSTIMIINH